MNFYVVGNGFDLHYGLKTSYSNFKSFLSQNGYGELVKKIDRLFLSLEIFRPKTLKHGLSLKICCKCLIAWMLKKFMMRQ